MTSGEPYKPSRTTNRKKILTTPHQPHSTRTRPCSKPLTGRIETQYSVIDGIAVRMPIPVKRIIVVLYFKGMPFRDVSVIMGLESKQVGRLKSRFLDAINGVVR